MESSFGNICQAASDVSLQLRKLAEAQLSLQLPIAQCFSNHFACRSIIPFVYNSLDEPAISAGSVIVRRSIAATFNLPSLAYFIILLKQGTDCQSSGESIDNFDLFWANVAQLFTIHFLLSICSKSPKKVQIWSPLRMPDKGSRNRMYIDEFYGVSSIERGLTEGRSQESTVKLTFCH